LADPLSNILKLADAQPVLSGGFTAGGSWGIHFPEPDKIKFFALIKGQCWLRIDDQEEPVRVEEGDVILLSAQRSFTLSSGGGGLRVAVTIPDRERNACRSQQNTPTDNDVPVRNPSSWRICGVGVVYIRFLFPFAGSSLYNLAC
jgi:hypothetical protein